MKIIEKYLLKALKLERKIKKMDDKGLNILSSSNTQASIWVLLIGLLLSFFTVSLVLNIIPLMAVFTVLLALMPALLVAFKVPLKLAEAIDNARHDRLEERQEDATAVLEYVKSKLLELAKEKGLVDKDVTEEDIVKVLTKKLAEENNKEAKVETENVEEVVVDEKPAAKKPAEKGSVPAKKAPAKKDAPAKKPNNTKNVKKPASKEKVAKTPSLLKGLTRKNKKTEETKVETDEDLGLE